MMLFRSVFGIYGLAADAKGQRYQHVNRRVAGPFLTAGYLLVAQKTGGEGR